MDNLHNKLKDNIKWYKDWHEHPHHVALHTALIVSFLLLVGLYLLAISYGFNKNNQGAVAYKPFEISDFKERMNGKTELSGDEAINALGYEISSVARYYGLGGNELKELFKKEKTLRINHNARLFYADDSGLEATLGDGTIPNNPIPDQIPDSVTFQLHSKPNSVAKIVLDFNGHTTSNTNWNTNGTIVSDPYTIDSDFSFNSTELNNIKTIWRAVAEDFSPFDVDVTTEEPVSYDPYHFTRIIISPSNEWYGSGAGGVAFVNSFRWGDGTPAFVFSDLLSNSNKNIIEAISHEAGHTLGLRHQASYDSSCNQLSAYNWGYGTNPGFGPIMGAAYNMGVSTFIDSGEYNLISTSLGCTAEQNDFSIISSPSYGDLRFANDETGSNSQSSNYLYRTVIAGVASVDQYGVTSYGDVDVYKLNSLDGDIRITVSPIAGSIMGNSDFRVRLLDGSLNVLSESNPNAVSVANVEKLGASAGFYYIEITPSGYLNQPEPGWYTATGAVGQYHITGSYPSINEDVNYPETNITSPGNGSTVSGNVNVSANATDNVGISKVEFYRDSVLIGSDISSPYSVSWSTAGLSNGVYYLTSKAFDTSNNSTVSASIYVNVGNSTPPPGDTVAPVAYISKPNNNSTITGLSSVSISATATDNIKVTKMELLIDGSLVKTSKTPSISYKWSTRSVAVGYHNIVVKAYDASGNVGVYSIVVLR